MEVAVPASDYVGGQRHPCAEGDQDKAGDRAPLHTADEFGCSLSIHASCLPPENETCMKLRESSMRTASRRRRAAGFITSYRQAVSDAQGEWTICPVHDVTAGVRIALARGSALEELAERRLPVPESAPRLREPDFSLADPVVEEPLEPVLRARAG